MNEVVIWGAGQCGKWLRKLLEGSGIRALAFVDSDSRREGEEFEGLPVRSPKDLTGMEWDALFVAIKGQERVTEVLGQLSELGLSKRRIETLPPFLAAFDARCAELDLSARLARERKIAGAVAELGVYRGDFAAKINEAFPDRTLYLFDTFEGFSQRDIEEERRGGFSSARSGEFGDTDEQTVRSKLPFPKKSVFRSGFFPESAWGLLHEQFCFVSLDADLYAPTYEGFQYFYPRLSVGGCIVLHDYDSIRFRGAGEAARRYCSERGLFIQPLWDMHGSAVLRKSKNRKENLESL